MPERCSVFTPFAITFKASTNMNFARIAQIIRHKFVNFQIRKIRTRIATVNLNVQQLYSPAQPEKVEKCNKLTCG